jgi:hypothetical protein
LCHFPARHYWQHRAFWGVGKRSPGGMPGAAGQTLPRGIAGQRRTASPVWVIWWLVISNLYFILFNTTSIYQHFLRWLKCVRMGWNQQPLWELLMMIDDGGCELRHCGGFLWSPSPMCGKALVTRQDAVNYVGQSGEAGWTWKALEALRVTGPKEAQKSNVVDWAHCAWSCQWLCSLCLCVALAVKAAHHLEVTVRQGTRLVFPTI